MGLSSGVSGVGLLFKREVVVACRARAVPCGRGERRAFALLLLLVRCIIFSRFGPEHDRPPK